MTTTAKTKKTVTTSVRFTREEFQAVRREAIKQGVSHSTLLRLALGKYLSKYRSVAISLRKIPNGRGLRHGRTLTN